MSSRHVSGGVAGALWTALAMAGCSGVIDGGSTSAIDAATEAQPDASRAIDGGAAVDAAVEASSACAAHRNLFGLNVSFADPVYLDDIVDLGASWIRVEVRYPQLPLSHYRDVITQANARGIKVLLLVGYSMTGGKPAWHGSDAEWNAYRAAFRADLELIGAEVGDIVDAFEVWNEPDHQLNGGYDPGVPAHQFGLLLADAASVLRAHSSAPLIIGGMATKNYGYIAPARASAGGTLDYDGIGVHTYGPPTWTSNIVVSELDTILTGWHDAAGLPIWLTEAGAVATPAAEQHAASYVMTLFGHIWDHHRDRVQTVLYFSWSDVVGFADERFGLVRQDGSHKPSYDVFRTLSQSCVD